MNEDVQAYLSKISPKLQGQIHLIPPSKLTAEERLKRLLSWRNEYSYYSRRCSKSGKSIISIHSEDKPYPVFSHAVWWGDSWDAREFGRDFDFTRPFFDQYRDLFNSVPQLALVNDNGVQSENCEYCMDFAKGKNCYLVTGSWEVRDCLYSTNVNHGLDLVDCESVNINNELVYESSYSQNLYNCAFLNKSANCSDCFFGEDLRSCNDCFCCVGLRQARFCMFNEELSEEEYRRRLGEYDLGSYRSLEGLKTEFEVFREANQSSEIYQIQCEDCRGDVLIRCRDVWGFDTFNAEHCRYFFKGDGPKHCRFVYQSGNPQWCYESITPDDSYNCCFTTWCWKDRFVFYSDNCHSSEHLFGCVGMKRGKYSVLNKEYSQEEYESLLTRIIAHMRDTGEWGEFFPESHSPFAYNETVAHEYFPKTREYCEEQKIPWKEAEDRVPVFATIELPDHIQDVADEIVKETLACSQTAKNYRVTKAELLFYRKMGLPIPRCCPEQRRKNRRRGENPFDLGLLQRGSHSV